MELMAVMVILALLVAVLLPNLVSAFSQVRVVLCQRNLAEIRKATLTWVDEQVRRGDIVGNPWDLQRLTGDGSGDAGWVAVAMQYASGSKDILVCPEGGELPPGTPVESQLVIRTSPTSGSAIPFVGLLEGGGFKVLKLSEEQWSTIGECDRYNPMEYKPGSNPDVYWWGYDDGAIGSGDYDFQDLSIKITKHGDGTATVFCITETAGRPELWSPDLSKCYARWEDTNVHHNRSVKGVEFKLKIGGSSHYGMNTAKLDTRSGHKVQALDYRRIVAESTDDWDDPKWDLNEDFVPDFLRHRGRLNVLYTDGSVKLTNREDIDPGDIEIERERWQP